MHTPQGPESSIGPSISSPHAQISTIRLPTDARENSEPSYVCEPMTREAPLKTERHGEQEHGHERQAADQGKETVKWRIGSTVIITAASSSKACRAHLTPNHELPQVRSRPKRESGRSDLSVTPLRCCVGNVCAVMTRRAAERTMSLALLQVEPVCLPSQMASPTPTSSRAPTLYAQRRSCAPLH